ncbi:MAG TPA: TetR/AcrR family transcriptional regulator [Pseudonocardia sp.]
MVDGDGAVAGRSPRHRPLRRDAVANRERLLAAAVTTLLRRGSAATLSQIAEEAGVGIGTLYRRYPTRDALMEALQARAFGLVIERVKEIEAAELPGIDALRMFLQRTVDHGSQLVMPAHGAPASVSAEVHRLRGELHGRIAAMVERGVRDGSVRPDLTARDLITFGSLIAIPQPGAADWAALMGRQIDLFVDAARAST